MSLWTKLHSPNSYVEALVSDVFADEAFGRHSGLDEVMRWDLHDGIHVLMVRGTRELSSFAT